MAETLPRGFCVVVDPHLRSAGPAAHTGGRPRSAGSSLRGPAGPQAQTAPTARVPRIHRVWTDEVAITFVPGVGVSGHNHPPRRNDRLLHSGTPSPQPSRTRSAQGGSREIRGDDVSVTRVGTRGGDGIQSAPQCSQTMSRQAWALDTHLWVRAGRGRRVLQLPTEHSFALQSSHPVTPYTHGW
jgi:hypothetical protein